MDGAGFVLAVVVHCKCFVVYEAFFTSYLPVSLYLAWLGIPILCSISGTPIGSGIPIPFLILKIPVGFFF